ncbi:MAG: uroporphyrinogen decarboxylase family protein [Planctomycetaceae bacterium]|jgi:uroporphyrinogen decarboxylase|nr:uroporphyrinogen decarboxylase family protein [Planctomycetaceae bacterium]
MSTSREIVTEAFALKRPERVPLGICLGGSWPFFVEGVYLQELLSSPPSKAAEIFYRVNERVGSDFVTVGTGATAFLIEALGGKIKFTKNGAPEIDSILISSPEDIDRLDLQTIFQTEKLKWLKAVAAETVKLNESKLNNNQRSIFVSGRAPFTLAGQLLGLETLSKSLYKNKPFAEKLLAFTTELSVAYFEFMLEVSGIDGIFIADPSASGDVVSVRHFESAVIPYLTAVIKRLKRYQKHFLIHICGNISDRLHLLPQTGIEMVSVDSKVDLRNAKQILNGKIGLAGNVNPVFVLEEKTADEIYIETQKCLNDAAGDGGFMLLPGCDLSAKVSEENIRAFVAAAHEWRNSL